MLETFEFFDSDSDWRLHPMSLGPINLLVGMSGVGKSRILNALMAVARSATGGGAPAGCKWKLTLKVGQTKYSWAASVDHDETGVPLLSGARYYHWPDSPVRGFIKSIPFVSEEIADEQGRILASRTPNGRIVFKGSKVPHLKPTESLISLFRDEPDIAPLFGDLSNIYESSTDLQSMSIPRHHMSLLTRNIANLDDLRRKKSIRPMERLALLQILDRVQFDGIVSAFMEIFPTVTDLQVGYESDLIPDGDEYDDDLDWVTIVMKEIGVKEPIPLRAFSSGMVRTLVHLIELALAPSGSTILIDEYENSLGVNCLPAVTRHLLERTRDLQLIATSHHPYVINNIDLKYWRVVTRRGGDVRVLDATAIPELNTASRQDAFIRLLNSESYMDGMTADE